MPQPDDILLVDLASPAIALLGAYQEIGVTQVPLEDSYYSMHSHQLGLAEVALPPSGATGDARRAGGDAGAPCRPPPSLV